jgi:hypothetical protein
MRVLVIVKATPESENEIHPGGATAENPRNDEELMRAMGNYNEELVNAGIILAMDGLHPSRRGARVRFDGSKRTVIDGPFTETKELVAGFWIWQVQSMDEAIEWLKRAPFDGGAEVEIRPIYEPEDFATDNPAFDAEMQAQEERIRAQLRQGGRS